MVVLLVFLAILVEDSECATCNSCVKDYKQCSDAASDLTSMKNCFAIKKSCLKDCQRGKRTWYSQQLAAGATNRLRRKDYSNIENVFSY